MNLEKLITVSGKDAGVYTLITSRNEGVIVQDFATQKNNFIPSRGNQFTPMQSISVYDTENETKPIAEIFTEMKANLENLPLPNPKDSDAALREYFSAIMPSHDRSRVYISDIKKIIKWFVKLDAAGLTEPVVAEEDTTEADTAVEA